MPSQPPGSALPAFEELLLQPVSPGQGAKALRAMALAPPRSFPCCISAGAGGGKKERQKEQVGAGLWVRLQEGQWAL